MNIKLFQIHIISLQMILFDIQNVHFSIQTRIPRHRPKAYLGTNKDISKKNIYKVKSITINQY